jgi:hypothetical protein
MALNTVKLSAANKPIMLSVVMLSGVMVNVVMLSVVAPFRRLANYQFWSSVSSLSPIKICQLWRLKVAAGRSQISAGQFVLIENLAKFQIKKYNRTSCLELIKIFFTEDYFTKHTNITTF